MTRDQLIAIAAFLDGFQSVVGGPLHVIRAVVREGFVDADELADAAWALSEATGTDPFVDAGDLEDLDAD